jgi:hypothetical protein
MVVSDKLLLVGAAVLICVIGVAAFVLGDIYHLNPYWLFLAFGSVGMVPVIARNYPTQFKRPAFVLVFAGWVMVHGLIVAGLIRWVSITFWVPVFGLELLAGYFVIFRLFGTLPSNKI